MKILKKIFISLITLKALFLILSFALPFSHPHIHRQSDTLGVSFRYFQRLFGAENLNGDFIHNFMPAILQSGELMGIMPMEFPILNLLSSIFFAIFPYFVAIFFIRFFLLFLLFGLGFFIYKELSDLKFKKINFKYPFALIFITSITATYLGHFIPDFLSFLLTFLGVILLYKQKKLFLSIILMTLGLFIKPTSVIVFAYLFYNLDLNRVKKYILPVLIATALTGIYYLKINPMLLDFADFKPLFKTRIRSPLNSMFLFWTSFKELINLFNNQLFFPFFLLILGVFSFIKIITEKGKFIKNLFTKELVIMLLILMVQLILISFLDGPHAFRHSYYFIGCSYICSFILCYFINEFGGRFIKIVFLILFITTLDQSYYKIKAFFNPSQNIWASCNKIRNQNLNIDFNKSLVVKTVYEKYPWRGNCLGVRTNGKEANLVLKFIGDDDSLDFRNPNMNTNGCTLLSHVNTVSLYQCH